MEFGVLGPLEALDGGQPLSLGSGRQRALLALLLVHANEALPVDRIIDDLWERPPPTAAKIVQGYVSRLRKSLGDDRIVTHPAGYLLRVEPGELDVDRVETLRAQARQADPAVAASLLREALALWRGEPLADVAYSAFAQPEIGRLEELRLALLEDRIDADLALGSHADLLPELESLVARYPLQERLRAQQMVALYRCGRQADALAVYQDARRTLDDELGIQPGERLRSLEQAILNQDETLAAPAPSPAALRASRGRHRGLRFLVAGAAILLVAAFATAVVALNSGSGSTGLATIQPGSLGEIDPSDNRLTAQVPLAGGPGALAVGDGAVWVAREANESVAKVDPRSKRVLSTIPVASTPSAIAVGPGGVWVASGLAENGTIARIQPASARVVQTATVRVDHPDPFAPPSPSAIGLSGGEVWTNSNPRGILARFSTVSKKVLRSSVGPPHSIDGIAVGFGAVWIASGADDTVLRLDPRTAKVTDAIPIAAAPRGRVRAPAGITAGYDSIWVADSLTSSVTRIDPALRSVTATIPVGRRPTVVAAGEGAVWALNNDDGTVSRIDPRTNLTTATIHVAPHVAGLAVGSGGVWVSVAGAGPTTVATPPARAARLLPCGPLSYGRNGRPQYLLASDLPFVEVGGPSPVTAQMTQAIRLVLEQHGFRAGPYTVGYQACDDSTREAEGWESGRCLRNGRMFAGNPSLLAVVGTYNSGCAELELPAMNASPSGPLAMISPSNTYVGLTTSGPATAPLEPDVYYPTGIRSYARVAGNDQAQGAADALLASQLGIRRLYLLADGTGTAAGDAYYMRRAAERLGIRVVGSSAWSPRDTDYSALARRVKAAGPDGVDLTGCVCALGPKLLRALRAALGPRVPFLAPDNFMANNGEYGRAGSAATGIYISAQGEAPPGAGAAARRFAAAFRRRFHERIVAGDVYATAQAAETALAAIAASDGTRSSVTHALLAQPPVAGPLGQLRFDRNGDSSPSVFSIYRIRPGATGLGQTSAQQGLGLDRVILARPALARP
jgi:YVTN family beta-propeller protein